MTKPTEGYGLVRPIRLLIAIEAVFIASALIIYFLYPSSSIAVIVGLALATTVVLYGLIDLLLAKNKAIRKDGEPVPFWKGFGEFVCWNPTKGVLFLKNKHIHFVDSNAHDGGGIRVIYPHFGEELVLQIPLEIQTLGFEDKEVLTKEYMPLAVRGTMYWKVVDLSKFYLLVSKEIHHANDRGEHQVNKSVRNPQLESAEYWLRSMAEEKTRAVISRISTGLLIADKLAADLPAVFNPKGETLFGGENLQPNRNATEGLASAIKTEFAAGVAEYGLEIHRVALQEVKLDPQIYAAAVEACKSAYLPIKAKAEALEASLKLQAQAEVIGKDALGLKEIAKNMPAPAFPSNISAIALQQEVLEPFFRNWAASLPVSQSTPQSRPTK